MVTVGIDVGSKTCKAVVVRDGQVAGKGKVATGFGPGNAARQALAQALSEAGLTVEAVAEIAAIGAGKEAVDFASRRVSEIAAAARGGIWAFPSARTVIDVGAEEGRVLRLDPDGRVLDFVVNEKCAAGAGTFLESMARTLETSVEELGRLALEATQEVPINAQCAVFAESEVVSLIHARVPKADIARAVHEAMAARISSLVRRVGVEREVVLIGGTARSVGLIESLRRELGVEVYVPHEPELVSAIGAALVAAG
ncbi:MAG: acyl-CoA dehydratase activase [Moorellales bacterium]